MQKENSKDFKIKRLGEHHNLYIQSDKKTKIIQKTKVRLDLLTDIDILLMVGKKKVAEAKYVMLFIDVLKLTPNIWRIVIKIKNHYSLNIGMLMICRVGQ